MSFTSNDEILYSIVLFSLLICIIYFCITSLINIDMYRSNSCINATPKNYKYDTYNGVIDNRDNFICNYVSIYPYKYIECNKELHTAKFRNAIEVINTNTCINLE